MIAPVQRTLFDLVQETHQLLREKEVLEGQYIDVVVRIGQNLIDIRPLKSYGEFIPFVESEFDITRQSANNYIHVAETYGNNVQRVGHLPLRIVYELASPSMPEEVRTQVEAGTIPPTLTAIREEKGRVSYTPPVPGIGGVTAPFDAVSQLLQGTHLDPRLPVYGPYVNGNDVHTPKTNELVEQRVGYEHTGYEFPRRNVDNIPIAVPHISSKNNEWYTPEKYIDAARELMGGIDLDPASCKLANETVKAARYYDITQNGLDKDWTGTVWLNPPYGRSEDGSNQALWSQRLIQQYKAGITKEAILLVNAAVDTIWFQELFDYPVCLTLGRINFTTPDPVASGSTHGSAFVYFGPQPERFFEIFSEFGTVVKRW